MIAFLRGAQTAVPVPLFEWVYGSTAETRTNEVALANWSISGGTLTLVTSVAHGMFIEMGVAAETFSLQGTGNAGLDGQMFTDNRAGTSTITVAGTGLANASGTSGKIVYSMPRLSALGAATAATIKAMPRINVADGGYEISAGNATRMSLPGLIPTSGANWTAIFSWKGVLYGRAYHLVGTGRWINSELNATRIWQGSAKDFLTNYSVAPASDEVDAVRYSGAGRDLWHNGAKSGNSDMTASPGIMSVQQVLYAATLVQRLYGAALFDRALTNSEINAYANARFPTRGWVNI